MASRRTHKQKKGHTLIEVLVACALFVVFLSGIVVLFVQAVRSFRFGEQRIQVISEARIGLDRISHDLKRAKFILYPDESVLKGEGSSIVVFSSVETRQGGEQKTSTNIFGFNRNSEDNTVQFLLYAPDFDVSNPTAFQPIERKIIARNVEMLNFKQDDLSNPQIITIRYRTLRIYDDQIFLLTKIFIRH